MGKLLFGLESELAMTLLSFEGQPVSAGSACGALLAEVRRSLRNIPDVHACGVFLTNGGRLYVDAGHHPEWSTPEVTDPWEAARYAAAGSLIMQRVSNLIIESRADQFREMVITRCNVDYVSETTWGAHESYFYTGDVDQIAEELLPFLASRVVYTGAGGLDPRGCGISFVLSPRLAGFFGSNVSRDTQGGRGLVNTKDEPLSRGGSRLHLICGDNLCSQTAVALKAGATALVVAMASNGAEPGRAVRLIDPIGSLRRFIGDPTCTTTAPLLSGKDATAIAIQRHYLQEARSHAEADYMPDWTGRLCDLWERVLDGLQTDVASMAEVLDWPLKLQMMQDHAEQRGCAWKDLPSYTRHLMMIAQEIARFEESNITGRMQSVFTSRNPIPRASRKIARSMNDEGLSWDDVPAILELREQLWELDTRFSQLGPRGMFNALDDAGFLQHSVCSAEMVEKAVSEPPADTRAALRGAFVQRYGTTGRERSPFYCDWTNVLCPSDDEQSFDMPDPFSATHAPETARAGRGSRPLQVERNRLWSQSMAMSSFLSDLLGEEEEDD